MRLEYKLCHLVFILSYYIIKLLKKQLFVLFIKYNYEDRFIYAESDYKSEHISINSVKLAKLFN